MTHPFQGSSLPGGRLARELGTLFDGWNAFSWPDTTGERTTRAFPTLNAWVDDEALFVEAELPGLGLDEIEITVLGEDLTLSGERQDVIEEGTSPHLRERGLGAFKRTLRLPHAVDTDKVEARLENGVLTITLPRAEAERPRRIPVTGA